MMRKALLVCGLLIVASVAMAADGVRVVPRVKLPETQLRQLKMGLPATALSSLGGTVTRAQQLQFLSSSPAWLKQLQALGAPQVTGGSSSDALWNAGITLTPLAATYPAGADYDTSVLSLRTRAGMVGPLTPLPHSAQNPPLLWLNVGDNADALLWIEAKWPVPGTYLITFFMKDLFPNSLAKPRTWKSGLGMMDLAPNTPSGGDRWTVLVDASDPQHLEQDIAVYPAESGFGFTFCCLSKVVVSRL